jgi:gliding motility-associated-like protein/uncharacterized repeat protein (TIGR01451 family)
MKINSLINNNTMKNKLLLIITAVTLFTFPMINYGQVINLGTAADFVLFSSAGAIGNTGISQVTGNVGTNSGAITGFGNVNGVMHNGDGASANCAADLTIAYNQLNATIPTFFPAPLLGNGQILNAGVYSIAAPATLNLDLTLDGQGNASAVFIFKIQGSFLTNAGAKVHLVNGAKACNVFWKVEGLVGMAAGTAMKGTIVANNAAITMMAGDTLEGRALSTAGAVTIDNVLAYTPIGCGSPTLTGPIPPTLGTVDCYALFTSNGPAQNNLAVTRVTGDIGTNLGTTTGFGLPNLIVGNVHGVPDGSTASCAADLLNVYNYLNTLPFDIELLYPAQFGNRLVLTPHTYRMNAAATFVDTLYLNALGDPNAVFVIQINNGGLTTGTYAKINLINGAQAKNVFWKVEGAISIADFSNFKGTFVSNNGAISLAKGVIIDGRALTTNGALNTASVNVTIPAGSCGSAPSPSITTGPTTQTVCSGNSVSFSVVASGSGLTYQWRIGNVNLVNGGNISGAQTATLTINPATIADAANNYNVVVSGTSAPSATSTNVSLIINSGPVITAQPADQTACPGGLVSFSVAATGTGLTYQWKKGLVNLINGANISGATTATLSINPVSISDTSSFYYVVVTGGCPPNDTSINVSLKLNSPIIITEPSNQAACVGSSASFSVAATGTGLSYQWKKGLVNLIDGGNISGALTATLTINPVGALDAAANYNVVVSGGCAPNDTSINVSLIIGGAIITTEPTNKTICAGSAVSFSVAASGAGLNYQWKKGLINLINGGNISGATTATLTINPANVTDTSSFYNVVVSGGCAPNDTSIKVSLLLNTAPIITTAPSNQTVCVGSSASFSIAATGNGLSYQWKKGLVNLINGGNISGAQTATLTINPTAISDAANNYNVVINGACTPSVTSINVSLTVNALPVANANSNSPICTGSSINLIAQTVTGGTYNWAGPNSYTTTTQNPAIVSASIANSGTYSLTVSSNSCTSITSTINVIVNNCPADLSIVKAVNNTTPIIGNSVVFTIVATNNGPINATGVAVNDVLQNGYSYVASSATAGIYNPSTGVWTIGNMNNGSSEVLTVTVTVIGNGNYVNTAIIYGNEPDLNMANNVSSIETFPSDFFIPEGFSPNGDGINDLFVIRGILNFPNNKFEIFNRWGNIVFDAKPYKNTWDGKATKGLRVGGDELPVGTYFYVLDLGDGSPVFKGTIYLNR